MALDDVPLQKLYLRARACDRSIMKLQISEESMYGLECGEILRLRTASFRLVAFFVPLMDYYCHDIFKELAPSAS
jgi:hypothetical protein